MATRRQRRRRTRRWVIVTTSGVVVLVGAVGAAALLGSGSDGDVAASADVGETGATLVPTSVPATTAVTSPPLPAPAPTVPPTTPPTTSAVDPFLALQQCGLPDGSGNWASRGTGSGSPPLYDGSKTGWWWTEPDVKESRDRIDAALVASGDFRLVLGALANVVERRVRIVTTVDPGREEAMAIRSRVEAQVRAAQPGFEIEVKIACLHNREIERLMTEINDEYEAPWGVATLRWMDRPAGQIFVHFYGDAPEAREVGEQISRRYGDRARVTYGGEPYTNLDDGTF